MTFKCTKIIQFGERLLHIPLLRIAGSPLCPVDAYLRMARLVPARRSCPAFLSPGARDLVPLSKRSFVSNFRVVCPRLEFPLQKVSGVTPSVGEPPHGPLAAAFRGN